MFFSLIILVHFNRTQMTIFQNGQIVIRGGNKKPNQIKLKKIYKQLTFFFNSFVSFFKIDVAIV